MNFLKKLYFILKSSNLKFIPIYHYASLTNALLILKTDKLHGNFGARFTKNYFLHKSGYQGLSGISVQIEFNRDKLKNNYKIKPIKDTNIYSEYDEIKDKSEEMIEKTIESVTKYITRIVLFKNTAELVKLKLY